MNLRASLPPNLSGDVLALAAEQIAFDKRSLLSLSLVCSEVNSLVFSLLYRSVLLQTPLRAALFFKAITTHPRTPGPLVKRFHVDFGAPFRLSDELISDLHVALLEMHNLKDLSVFGYDTRESLRHLSSVFRLDALSVSQIRDPFMWSFIQNQQNITQLEIREYIPSTSAPLDATVLPDLTTLTSCPVGFVAFGPGRPITTAVIRACPTHMISRSILNDLVLALNQTALPLTKLDLNCEKWTGANGWDFVTLLKSTGVCSTLTHLKITDTLMYFVSRQHNDLDYLDSLLELLEGYTSLVYFEVAEGASRPLEPLSGCPDKQVAQMIVNYLWMAGKLRGWKSKCPKLEAVRFFGQELP